MTSSGALAFDQLVAGRLQFPAQGLKLPKTGNGNLDDRAYPLRLQTVHHIGAHPRAHCRADGIAGGVDNRWFQ